MPTRYLLTWKNQPVGYIEDPRQWPVVWRGRWKPLETEATDEFLTALARGRFVWVVVETPEGGELFATIETLPVDEVELRLTVDEQDTVPIDPNLLDDES
ncbi:MAG: hypothetical protein Kow0077_01980 [Anaerolineae bacterium]